VILEQSDVPRSVPLAALLAALPAHVLRFDGHVMQVSEQPLRTIEDPSQIFFERHWADHLTNAIAHDDYRHR